MFNREKSLFISVAVIALGFSAAAQQIDESKIPAAVKTSFAKNYPGQKAKWELENGQFEADFKQNGKNISALFSANGALTESEVAVDIMALPPAAIAYLKVHYKGAAIAEGAKITKADGTVNYEAEVNKIDVVFDEKGNFLKEVKD